jgi:hypothetical protein
MGTKAGTLRDAVKTRLSQPPEFARVIRLITTLQRLNNHATLEAIAAGEPVSFIPEATAGWAVVALQDIQACIRYRLLKLHRCKECRHWFTTKDARRVLCWRPDCQHQDRNERQKRKRVREKHLDALSWQSVGVTIKPQRKR